MITIAKLDKSFGRNRVLDGLEIHVPPGSVCAILGPSGCGKSTLLNIICGLERQESGSVDFDGRIGYMMQEPYLLPWRTLEENAMLGVEVVEALFFQDRSLRKYFDAFELDEHYGVYPSESSGGMKQRAALIRTLLLEPSILLLDEPFSGLDFDIKLKVQREIVKYQMERNVTTLLVTHDIEDAIALSDKIVVFSETPAHIKAEIEIELGTAQRHPVEARKSQRFRDYFVRIWKELKYLDGDDGY